MLCLIFLNTNTIVPPTFTTWLCLSGQTPKLWIKQLHFEGKSTVKSWRSPQKCIKLLVSQHQLEVRGGNWSRAGGSAGRGWFSGRFASISDYPSSNGDLPVSETCSHLPLSSSSFQSAAVNQPPRGRGSY